MKKILLYVIIILSSTGCTHRILNFNDVNSKYFDPKGDFLSIIATSHDDGSVYLLINQFYIPANNEKIELSVDEEKHLFSAKCTSTYEAFYSEYELALMIKVYKIDSYGKKRIVIDKRHFSRFPQDYIYYLPIVIDVRTVK